MLMSGSDSLKRLSFEGTKCIELMTQCPATVDEAQLEELGAIIKKRNQKITVRVSITCRNMFCAYRTF